MDRLLHGSFKLHAAAWSGGCCFAARNQSRKHASGYICPNCLYAARQGTEESSRHPPRGASAAFFVQYQSKEMHSWVFLQKKNQKTLQKTQGKVHAVVHEEGQPCPCQGAVR